MVQHGRQVEVRSEFLRQQGEHNAPHGSSRQQVGAGLLELAGARAEQNEPVPPLFDEAVNLVEERRETTIPLRRDEVANRFGARIASPARTIADTGADPSVVIEATWRAIATGLVSPNELRAAVKRRCSESPPWTPAFRAFIDNCAS